MDYLINPSESSSNRDCCFIGVQCDCLGSNVCAQCGTLCAVNCSELCGGQFCAPARMDPMSNS